jgi:hypothetical protein
MWLARWRMVVMMCRMGLIVVLRLPHKAALSKRHERHGLWKRRQGWWRSSIRIGKQATRLLPISSPSPSPVSVPVSVAVSISSCSSYSNLRSEGHGVGEILNLLLESGDLLAQNMLYSCHLGYETRLQAC